MCENSSIEIQTKNNNNTSEWQKDQLLAAYKIAKEEIIHNF